MQIGQRITHRRAKQYGFIFRDITDAFHALAQVLALDIVHHQVLALIADHEMIGNPRQVGMAQISQDHGLQPELARIFIGCE